MNMLVCCRTKMKNQSSLITTRVAWCYPCTCTGPGPGCTTSQGYFYCPFPTHICTLAHSSEVEKRKEAHVTWKRFQDQRHDTSRLHSHLAGVFHIGFSSCRSTRRRQTCDGRAMLRSILEMRRSALPNNTPHFCDQECGTRHDISRKSNKNLQAWNSKICGIFETAFRGELGQPLN